MSTCPGITRAGTRCAVVVKGSQSTYCYQHDPANRERRSRAASKAARSKGVAPGLLEVQESLRKLYEDLLEGAIDKGVASVGAQVLGVLVRSFEVQRRQREQDEVLARIEALEREENVSHGW